MSFLGRLFGKKDSAAADAAASAYEDPASNPNMIRLFDGYGREMFVTKEEWRDNVLIGNIEKAINDPEQLYSLLVGALEDGFAADIVPHAEHFQRIDPLPSRGATILGIVYMEVNRLDDAQRVLDEFIAKHGEEGVVLTNLAKVHSRRGDEILAESVLWHALEVDPNQDNGLDWYAAIHRDRDGESAALDAFRRVAALPQSWRAKLWLARDALEHRDLASASALYTEALALAPQPIPTDLLMQMSGDLGNNGYLSEIIRLSEPCFDPSFHGLQFGNNLIKANLELGRAQNARHILDQLYAEKRPDWKQTLDYWDTELAKAGIKQQAKTPPERLSVTMMSIEGPLWTRDGSLFSKLLPLKRDNAPTIAVIGSTALLQQAANRPALQLSDGPGRISRAIPLLFVEQIQLNTDAVGLALIPWAQGHGFALFGKPYDDQSLCNLVSNNNAAQTFVLGFTLDAANTIWKFDFRLIRKSDCQCLATSAVEAAPDNLAPAIEQLVKELFLELETHAGVSMNTVPSWYEVPGGQDASDYLLRLEQQLATTCMNVDILEGGGLSGEREILDGILHLCVRQSTNQTIRIIFAATLRQMKKFRPDILPEYREKILLLQQNHPLSGVVAQLVEETIKEVIEC